MTDLAATLQSILDETVTRPPHVPGVVAAVTDREGDIFVGVAGAAELGGGPMRPDTVLAAFSTTKAITGTVALQLAEEGRLDLDAPARRYVPQIGELRVIEGLDAQGQPRLRAPRSEITTRMLLLHTAGLGYAFCNEIYDRLAREHGQPGVATASMASLMTPLLFEPGTRWEYGSGVDWAGLVIESITGRRLGAAMAERVLAPLGMTSTAFTLTPDMQARRASLHRREADGALTALPDFVLPQPPEIDMGGHGLYSTVPDYMKFIRMWLNDGAGPEGPVLRPETVQMAVRNGLGALKIRGLPGVRPHVSNDVEFFPGQPKSWALSFMVNDVDAPTGRPAGSLGWAGLANLYYWIDRRNGIGGFWGTQLLPFADAASFGGYLAFETAVYAHRAGTAAA